MTGLEASNRRLWRKATAITPRYPGTRRAKLPLVTRSRSSRRTARSRASTRSRARSGCGRETAARYLALELVDTSGRIAARVWNDVDLLDGRFAAGDAVRVLGRVERFRNQLQVDVRTLEPAEGVDPAALTPGLRRDADELEGFLEFLVGEVHDDALRGVVTRALAGAPLRAYPATPDGHHSYAGGLLEHTVGVATLCRELAQIHPRLRADLLLAAALVHDVGRTRELGRPPVFAPTEEGRLLGHVHLGLAACSRSSARPPSCCTRSPATTTRAPRAPPRRPCSTTRTSSTPSPRRGRCPD